RAGYIIDAHNNKLTDLEHTLNQLLHHDPLKDTRRELKAYYLGDIPNDAYTQHFINEALATIHTTHPTNNMASDGLDTTASHAEDEQDTSLIGAELWPFGVAVVSFGAVLAAVLSGVWVGAWAYFPLPFVMLVAGRRDGLRRFFPEVGPRGRIWVAGSLLFPWPLWLRDLKAKNHR